MGQRKPRLQGIIPPIGTPLRIAWMRPACVASRIIIEAGVDGIFVNGTMGGFAFLPDEEQTRVISVAVDAAGV